MKSKTILLISACLIGSISIILLLYQISYNLNHKRNAFVRINSAHLSAPQILDLNYNSYYIAGTTNSHVYLANFTNPSQILIMNYTLTDTQYVNLKTTGKGKIAWKSLTVRIDSPDVYMMEYLTPTFLHGTLSAGLKICCMMKSGSISASLPISQVSWILRTYNWKSRQNILTKERLDIPNLKKGENILEKQVDGYFCTDGILLYEPNILSLVYVYYYRNQFICLDTSLNIKFKAKTIDTNSTVKIRLGDITSEKTMTLATPPPFVNKRASVYKDKLFINSALLANNEHPKALKGGAAIDVYSLRNGYYEFSFYLSNFKNQPLSCFCVNGKRVIAIFDHYVLVSTINR